MNKLSFSALEERTEGVTSDELLNSISGGTENACDDGPTSTEEGINDILKGLS